MLFTEHFSKTVIINRLSGIELTESSESYSLHVWWEDWPSLVEWSVDHGLGGLENLAAILPGCSGSAPIQNIGAMAWNTRCM